MPKLPPVAAVPADAGHDSDSAAGVNATHGEDSKAPGDAGDGDRIVETRPKSKSKPKRLAPVQDLKSQISTLRAKLPKSGAVGSLETIHYAGQPSLQMAVAEADSWNKMLLASATSNWNTHSTLEDMRTATQAARNIRETSTDLNDIEWRIKAMQQKLRDGMDDSAGAIKPLQTAAEKLEEDMKRVQAKLMETCDLCGLQFPAPYLQQHRLVCESQQVLEPGLPIVPALEVAARGTTERRVSIVKPGEALGSSPISIRAPRRGSDGANLIVHETLIRPPSVGVLPSMMRDDDAAREEFKERSPSAIGRLRAHRTSMVGAVDPEALRPQTTPPQSLAAANALGDVFARYYKQDPVILSDFSSPKAEPPRQAPVRQLRRADSFQAPQAPIRFAAREIGPSWIQFYWEAPVFDGGCPISDYEINWETYDPNQGKVAPAPGYRCAAYALVDAVPHNGFRVVGLLANTVYQNVTVRARNLAGWSVPCKALPRITTLPPLKSAPPLNLHVDRAGANELWLSWGEPHDDGGTPIQEYEIAYTWWHTVKGRVRDSIVAHRMSRKTNKPSITFCLDELVPDTVFTSFNVRAITLVGEGEWSLELESAKTAPKGTTLPPEYNRRLPNEPEVVFAARALLKSRDTISAGDVESPTDLWRPETPLAAPLPVVPNMPQVKPAVSSPLRRLPPPNSAQGGSTPVVAPVASSPSVSPTTRAVSPTGRAMSPMRLDSPTRRAREGSASPGARSGSPTGSMTDFETVQPVPEMIMPGTNPSPELEPVPEDQTLGMTADTLGLNMQPVLRKNVLRAAEFSQRTTNPVARALFDLYQRETHFQLKMDKIKDGIVKAIGQAELFERDRRAAIFGAAVAGDDVRKEMTILLRYCEAKFDAELEFSTKQGKTVKDQGKQKVENPWLTDQKLYILQKRQQNSVTVVWRRYLKDMRAVRMYEDRVKAWIAEKQQLEVVLAERREKVNELRVRIAKVQQFGDQVAQNWARLPMRKYFRLWVLWIAQLKHERLICEKTIRRMLNANTGAAFRTWLAFADRMAAAELARNAAAKKAAMTKSELLLQRAQDHREDMSRKIMDTFTLLSDTALLAESEPMSQIAKYTPVNIALPEFVLEEAKRTTGDTMSPISTDMDPLEQDVLGTPGENLKGVAVSSEHPFACWIQGNMMMRVGYPSNALELYKQAFVIEQSRQWAATPAILALPEASKRRESERSAAEFERNKVDRLRRLVLCIGDAYSALGLNGKAELVYWEFTKASVEVGDVECEAVGLERLSSMAMQQERFVQAAEWMEKAAGRWGTLGQREHKLRTLRLLRDIQTVRSDPAAVRDVESLIAQELENSRERTMAKQLLLDATGLLDKYRLMLSIEPSVQLLPDAKLELVSWSVPGVRAAIRATKLRVEAWRFEMYTHSYRRSLAQAELDRHQADFDLFSNTDSEFVITAAAHGIRQKIPTAAAIAAAAENVAKHKKMVGEHESMLRKLEVRLRNERDQLNSLMEELRSNDSKLVEYTLSKLLPRLCAFHAGNAKVGNVLGIGIQMCVCGHAIGAEQDINIVEQEKVMETKLLIDNEGGPPPADYQREEVDLLPPNDPTTDISSNVAFVVKKWEHRNDRVKVTYNEEPPPDTFTCPHCGRSATGRLLPGLVRVFAVAREMDVRLYSAATGHCLQTLLGDTRRRRLAELQQQTGTAQEDDGQETDSSDEGIGGSAETAATNDDLGGHTKSVTALWVGATQVVSGSADKTIRAWSIATGKVVLVMKGHRGTVWSLAGCPMERFLVSGSSDCTARVWELKSGECLRVIRSHTDTVKSIGVSVDTIVTSAMDGVLAVWQFKRRSPPPPVMTTANGIGATPAERRAMKKARAAEAAAREAADELRDDEDWSNDDAGYVYGLQPQQAPDMAIPRKVATRARRRHLKRFGLKDTAGLYSKAKIHDESGDESDDAASQASGSTTKTGRTAASGRTTGSRAGKDWNKTALELAGALISRDFEELTTTRAPTDWSADTQSQPVFVGKLHYHKAPVTNIQLDVPLMVTADEHGIVVVWDLLDGKPLRSMKCNDGTPILHLQFSPSMIMTYGRNGTLEARETSTGARRLTIRPDPTGEMVQPIGFQFDERQILLVFPQGVLRRWRILVPVS